MKAWLIVTALLFSPTFAKAEVDGPIWTCSLNAEATGRSVHFLIGKTSYRGTGNLHCVNFLGGDTGNIPIDISYAVWGLGLGFSEIDHVQLFSVGVKVANPNDLFGTYGVAHLFGAGILGGGIDVDMIAQLDKDGVGLNLGFRAKSLRGLEITALNFGRVKILPAAYPGDKDKW